MGVVEDLGGDAPAASCPPASVVTWGYRPGLDGLRSVAVYLVVAFHAGLVSFGGGFVGVDLFFVLSGYVVTNVVIAELHTSGSFDLRRFYARRFRRLAPAAGVCVVGTSLVYLVLKPVVERLSALNDAQAALLYYSNWHSIAEAADYFAEGSAPSPFVHFWSLAIEEQFYFVFPLLIVVVSRFAAPNVRSRGFIGILGFLIVLSVASQIFWAARNETRAYYGTDTRIYQILCGCLLAVVLRRSTFTSLATRSWVVASVSLGGFGVLASGLVHVSPSLRGLLATITAVGLIGGLELAPTAGPSRVLAWRPLVFLGSISYSTYLWHWVVIIVVRQFVDLEAWLLFVAAAVVSSSLAALSSVLLEMPIRESKLLKGRNRLAIGASLAMTVAIAAWVVPPILTDEAPPRTVASRPVNFVLPEQVESYRSMPVPRDVPFAEVLNDKPSVPACPPKTWQDCTLVEGDGTNVLVVGDSIAVQFSPAFVAMAEKHDWTLTVNAVWGCPWQMGLVPRTDLNRQSQRRCKNQRDDWYEKVLPVLKPDVVVLAQLDRGDAQFADKVRPVDHARDDWPLDRLNEVTIDETVQWFESMGAEVVIIESPPFSDPAEPDPLDCLSAASTVGQCIFEPVDDLPSDLIFERVAAAHPSVALVDVDPIVCPELPLCVPVQRGLIAWRNGSHLTDRYVKLLEPEIEHVLLQSIGSE